ncbi:hypothetical protein FRC14_006192 [Serendipita sp. 396]|nr:hypothetical protein FRC14_006192 [Serendipita sp. 396]KAG8770654.1 hypothetical protein FRC15_003971 [Serendipita sp. 397]KAG8840413.1 hypothetical protein FRC20_005604 [Serendipita sp. 405]
MESMITEEEEEDEEEEEEESFRRLPLELFFTVPVQLRKARARARAAAARNSAATATAATVVGPSARTSPQTSLPVTPTGSMKSVNVPLLPSVDKLMVVVPAGTRDVGVGLGLTTTATTTATATATSPAGARGTGVGGSFERWSNFTVLGSKRARESDEVERPAKKALFVTTGRYNT